MKPIGARVSTAGGVQTAPLRAAAIGARAFVLFTKNQRQWQARPLTPETIDAFRSNLQTADIAPQQVSPHDSYLTNLCHPEPESLARSRQGFLGEVQRCRLPGLSLLNFHPGSQLSRITEEQRLARVAESINWVLQRSE